MGKASLRDWQVAPPVPSSFEATPTEAPTGGPQSALGSMRTAGVSALKPYRRVPRGAELTLTPAPLLDPGPPRAPGPAEAAHPSSVPDRLGPTLLFLSLVGYAFALQQQARQLTFRTRGNALNCPLTFPCKHSVVSNFFLTKGIFVSSFTFP